MGGAPNCDEDAAGERGGITLGKTAFPHRLQPMSAKGLVEEAMTDEAETGSMMRSPEMIAWLIPLRESQERSGATSSRKVGSWSSSIVRARKGCVRRLVSSGGGSVDLAISLMGRRRRMWARKLVNSV